MEEVHEEHIAGAERAQGHPDHRHEGVTRQDGSLTEHLEQDHHLDAPDSLSTTTEAGLHDRLHGTSHAEDD